MNRIDQIKRKYKHTTWKDPAFDDINFLLRIAEAAEDFVESFENYSKDLGESCITGPERKCRELKKALEGENGGD